MTTQWQQDDWRQYFTLLRKGRGEKREGCEKVHKNNDIDKQNSIRHNAAKKKKQKKTAKQDLTKQHQQAIRACRSLQKSDSKLVAIQKIAT